MKEAIGSTQLLIIAMSFIVLFSGLLALSINYSKAFKVKDGIIDRFEKHGGPNESSFRDIDSYIKKIGYNTKGDCTNFLYKDDSEEIDEDIIMYGMNELLDSNSVPTNGDLLNADTTEKYKYCYMEVSSSDQGGTGSVGVKYYKIYTFFSIGIPFLNFDNLFYVEGETVNIYSIGNQTDSDTGEYDDSE